MSDVQVAVIYSLMYIMQLSYMNYTSSHLFNLVIAPSAVSHVILENMIYVISICIYVKKSVYVCNRLHSWRCYHD